MNIDIARRALADSLAYETEAMERAIGSEGDFISGRITALRFALDLLEDDERSQASGILRAL